MERKIGEEFEYKGNKYRVCKPSHHITDICNECELSGCGIREGEIYDTFGDCDEWYRSDGNDVCFKIVDNARERG